MKFACSFIMLFAATTHFQKKGFNDALLDKLTGQWSLSGTVGKRPVSNRFSAEWVLGHQFLELSFESTDKQAPYLAKVSIGYDEVSERYVMHWLDNGGGRYSETLGYGVKSDNHIEFRFEYPEGPFINILSYNEKANTWLLHMTKKNSKGKWVVFGNEYLKRK
jgi:Protein of unknown function (DUF1579)